MTDDPRAPQRFASDVAVNLGAMGLAAVVGLVINLLITRLRGAAGLGVFNQVYAIYVVAAQLAAFGVHDSAHKHSAQHAADPRVLAAVTSAALAVSFVSATGGALLLAVLAVPLGAAAASPMVARGLLVVVPGVFFFALNKCQLGILNGLSRMRAFALAQALRVLAILAVVVAVGLSNSPSWGLAAAFTAAEVLLFPWLLLAIRPYTANADAAEHRAWRARHRAFGLRALPHGLLGESLVRVDVIMLGLFVSDARVGVYSLAAMFVEGIYQVGVVIRTVANPVLVRLVADCGQLARFCRRTGAASLCAVATVSVVVWAAFPLLDNFLPADLVLQARELLLVLCAGLCAYAVFIPSDQILLQAGFPARQSALMGANLAANVVMNAALIPRHGLRGAALATALTYALSGVTLNVAAAGWLGLRRTVLFCAARPHGSAAGATRGEREGAGG